MPATLPTSMPVAEIAREQADGHAGDDQVVRLDLLRGALRETVGTISPDMRTPFFQLVERLRNGDRCDCCGKTRVLIRLSAAYKRETEERPDPTFHCSCPGGPAYAGVGARYRNAAVVARHQLLYVEGTRGPVRYIAEGTRGRVTAIAGHIATVVFEGHVQSYLQHTDRLHDIIAIVEPDTPAVTTDPGEDFPATGGSH